MPASNATRPKPIIFKLLDYNDREQIWNARKNLKDANAGSDEKIFLSEDYPIEIKNRRRFLEPIRKKAVAENMKAFLTYDKLILEGKAYTVDNVDELPAMLHPSELATKRSDSHTGFFTGASPLSNFYRCTFEDDDGMRWSSVEQYYQFHKCTHHGERQKAQQILQTDVPNKCLSIAKQVKITDEKIWEDRAKEIMFEGCLLKFSQSNFLKQFLLKTEDTVLVEANPRDKFWAVGLGIQDPDLFNPTKWKGQNILGKTLRKVRDKLKAK